jgi:FkbM family methyltransferase
MAFQQRPMPYVLVCTAHGPLIMSRLDYQPGVPNQFLELGAYEPFEVSALLDLLALRHKYYGDRVCAIDCGAHIGVHTIEWCKLMTGWGWVLSIEAQERLYYALCGNIALNNVFNVKAVNAAVGASDDVVSIPRLDPYQPARIGSLELKPTGHTENIGQPIDYNSNMVQVPGSRLDSLALPRVDLIKLDIEGMEVEAIEGGRNVITQHKPFLVIEYIKSDRNKLTGLLCTGQRDRRSRGAGLPGR